MTRSEKIAKTLNHKGHEGTQRSENRVIGTSGDLVIGKTKTRKGTPPGAAAPHDPRKPPRHRSKRKNPALRREVCLTSRNAVWIWRMPNADCAIGTSPGDRAPGWFLRTWRRAVCGTPAPPRPARSAERSER